MSSQTQLDTDALAPWSELDSSAEQSPAEALGLDPRYEAVVMDTVSGYGPIEEAWATMKYPLNVSDEGEHGVIEGNGSRHARQYPDGSGVYESTAGTRLYAVRTVDGTIVWNERRSVTNPWSYKADVDVEKEIQIPFTFVGEVLTQQTALDMHDEDSMLGLGREAQGIDTWVDGEVWMRGVTRADLLEDPDEEGALLEHQTGSQLYVGYDSTAHDNQEMFGFVPFDGTEGVRAPSASDALDLLRPDEALDAENRQGEWFFAETTGDPRGTLQKPGVGERPYGGSPLENHVPREWKTHVPDIDFVMAVERELAESMGHWEPDLETPQDVFDALHEGDIPEEALPYERARELAEGIYVRGSVRHRESEHRMVCVDEWKQATTHDWDVITQDGRDYHVD